MMWAVPDPIPAGQVPVSALMVEALRRVDPDADVVLDEATVARLAQRLADTAGLLARSPLLAAPADRADAFHHLLVTLHAAVDHSILQTDVTEPMFSPVLPTHRVDWGARNPDGVYRRAYVSADHGYRIHGRLGNAKYVTFDLGGDGIEVDELDVDGEGRFELWLGGPERPERWFPLPAGALTVTTREFFDDWAAARRSVLRIDCLDADRRQERSAALVAAEFDVIADWLYEAGARFWLEEWHREVNRFGDFYRIESKRPTVCRGCWELGDDEALLLELPDPEAAYWGLQLASSLVHTLDVANRLTSVNNAQARVDDDGWVRVVIAHRDPGVPNWLDTTGLHHGEMILRVHRAADPVPPTARVVPLDDLPAPTVTADERRAQVAERREGVARLLCD